MTAVRKGIVLLKSLFGLAYVKEGSRQKARGSKTLSLSAFCLLLTAYFYSESNILASFKPCQAWHSFPFSRLQRFLFLRLRPFPITWTRRASLQQVAREMLLRHDFITPTLGGHVSVEKPALLYWMMIGSFKLFGVSEFAARVPAAISGLLTAAAVLVIARQFSSGPEQRDSFTFWSVLAAGTMLGIIVFSRAPVLTSC
jgi:hypothetical protein